MPSRNPIEPNSALEPSAERIAMGEPPATIRLATEPISKPISEPVSEPVSTTVSEPAVRPLRTIRSWIEVIHTLSLCGRQLRRVLAEATAGCSLSDTEFFLLWVCDEGPEHGVGQHDMAHALGVSGAQMSGMVYDLRDRGLLVLDRPVWDRRRQLLRITTSGRSVLDQTLQALAPLARQLECGIPNDDLSVFTGFLSQLTALTRSAATGPETIASPQNLHRIGERIGDTGLRRAS